MKITAARRAALTLASGYTRDEVDSFADLLENLADHAEPALADALTNLLFTPANLALDIKYRNASRVA